MVAGIKSKKGGKGNERPPPVDRLIKPAIGVGLALLAYQFFKGIQSEITRVNVEDELELREVFFGERDGNNYAVLCHPDDANYPVSSVFQDAHNDGSAPAEFKLMDCDFKLAESGKTVAERFKLNLKQRPTIFVSGKLGEPKQVPAKHLKTGGMLVKALRNLLVPKAEKIETTQDLRTKCLDKDVCALLLKGSKQSPNYVKDAMQKLLVEYPQVAFAAIDTSVLYVKGLEAEYLPELVSGQPRFAVFQKAIDPKKKDRLKTSVASLPTSGVAYGPMSNLIGSVIQNTQTMEKVSALPTVKTRSKKLEEEERAKRQRRADQQRRQASADAGSTPGGYFSENDGSREGRRAERERRREEHRKNNPNFKEKTPEEIAEMERKRRQRMEEESAKWNMNPEDIEDLLEENDGGSSGGTIVEEEADDMDVGVSDDEDEDILDLD